MTLDELIARLKKLREEYPQLASEIVGIVMEDGQGIVGEVNMYTRDGKPGSIIIEEYMPQRRRKL